MMGILRKLDKVEKEKGFTLLEVLISLAIIGIALVVILKVQFYNLKLCTESKNVLLAKMLAQEKMAKVELTDELHPHLISSPLEGEDRGEGVFEKNKDFSWILNSDEVEKGLRKVDLKVIWKEGNLLKDFCITTYLITANKAE